MDEIDTIVVHCSDSPQGRGDDAETIHRWHKDKGWDGIGYHYVINEYGEVESGRPEYWMGAHVSGHNENSLGICLIGKDEYTKNQMLSLVDLLDCLLRKYNKAKLYEHCFFDTGKSCPTFNDENKGIMRYFFGEKYIEKK